MPFSSELFPDELVDVANSVLQICRQNGLKLSAAESCTGGLVSALLTEISGSSDVFSAGFVTYSNAAKISMLGVSQTTLDKYGAVSKHVAHEMASGALLHSQCDIAVSITGIAGPGGSEFKPEGRVCFGFAQKHADGSINVQAETIEFGALGRTAVRMASAKHALQGIQSLASS